MAIKIEDKKILLFNDYIRREIDISEGLYTKHHYIRPGGKSKADTWLPLFSFDPGQPFEAAISINGKQLEAGFRRARRNWRSNGDFEVAAMKTEKTKLGELLEIHCRLFDLELPHIELIIRYEILDDSPVLIKDVTIQNISGSMIILDNVTVDIIKELRLGSELRILTDYYMKTFKEDDYYKTFTRIGFPNDIRLTLKHEESFRSFRCFEIVTENEEDTATFVIQRAIRDVAPWIKKTYIMQFVDSFNTYEEMFDFAALACKDGIESVTLGGNSIFTNIGDYELRPDLFPRGEDDLKRLVEHYHKHNMIIRPYCSTTIACESSKIFNCNSDWQYLGPNGIRYIPGELGNMCYQSPWGNYIHSKLFHLVDDIGFDGLEIDGPYHGLPCVEKNHNHKSPESVFVMNWMWERDFFSEVRKRGLFVTAPQEDACLLLGANQVPGGYTEEDHAVMRGMDLVSAIRSRLYDYGYRLPSSSRWGFCAFDDYHEHSVGVSEEDTTTYDHILGSTFGYGHGGVLYGKKLYIGPNTKDIFNKWITFFRKNKDTLAGEIVHLVHPNGWDTDAIMHVSSGANHPALLLAFNPRKEVLEITLDLPLRFAGFKANSSALVEGYGIIALDSRATGIITLSLKPYEVKVLTINYEQKT